MVRLRSSLRDLPDKVSLCLFLNAHHPALYRRSLRRFEACPCRPTSRDLPSSLAQHGCSRTFINYVNAPSRAFLAHPHQDANDTTSMTDDECAAPDAGVHLTSPRLPACGLREQAAAEPLVHLYTAALVHNPAAVDNDRLRNTPSMANHVVSMLSKMFSLAETWDLVPQGRNPCRAVRHYREQSRERFLTPGEYRDVRDRSNPVVDADGLPYRFAEACAMPLSRVGSTA